MSPIFPLSDLVIPRGSNALVSHIKQNTKICVLGHADGICHLYIDRDADLAQAIAIAIDSKTSYPAACNAVETILVHSRLTEDDSANTIFKALGQVLDGFGDGIWVSLTMCMCVLVMMRVLFLQAGVQLFGGERASALFDLERASNLSHEYGSLKATVEIVDSVEDAIRHINAYGSSHTDTIISENAETAATFLQQVNASLITIFIANIP